MRYGKLLRFLTVVLVCAFTTLPMSVFADDDGSTTGQFEVENVAPLITALELWTTGGSPAQTNDMTPQVEYNVKVSITDGNALSDLSTVTVRVFYDANGTYAGGDEAGLGDTQSRAILTWTNGGAPWTISPAAATTWSLETGSCVEPTLTAASGTFEFHFKPGKVATETVAPAKWHVYAIADDGALDDDATDQNKNMNWLGEITVNTANVDWGALQPGSDFNGASNNETGISITYVSNGAYDEQVSASQNWTSGSVNATLDSTGAVANMNEFSLKADDVLVLGSAVFVEASPTYDPIDDTGTQTGESGDTVATNTLWLKLSSTFLPETYSGSIFYKITNGT